MVTTQSSAVAGPRPKVARIIAELTAMGLPGEPYAMRITSYGKAYKPDARAKDAEKRRRRERATFLNELEQLPADEPLPNSLTEIAERILERGRRQQLKLQGAFEQINSELRAIAVEQQEAEACEPCQN